MIRDGDGVIRCESAISIKPHKRDAPADQIDDGHQSKRSRQGLFRDIRVNGNPSVIDNKLINVSGTNTHLSRVELHTT